MRKIRYIFNILFALLVACPIMAQTVKSGSRITVATPAFQNGGEADTWVPIYVQGQLTTDFQNYSGLVVIDRQAARQLMEEQKISEQNAYLSGSEDEIQYATLVEADYLVSVMLIKTGSSYSLQCSIQNVKSSSIVGKVYSAPNLSETDLSSGIAIHMASYELLKGIGLPESDIAALKANGDKQQAEVAANVFTAKGMAVEQEGGSIVQAMAYYQKAVGSSSAIVEAAARLDGLTSQITGVNLGETALNDMKLRKQWEKIWNDMEEFVRNNWADIIYDPSLLDVVNPDYEHETVQFALPINFRLNPDVFDLWNRMYAAYLKTPKLGKWNLEKADWDKMSRNIMPEITIKVFDCEGNKITSAKTKLDKSIWYMRCEWKEQLISTPGINPNLITETLSVKIEPSCSGGRVRAMQSKKL